MSRSYRQVRSDSLPETPKALLDHEVRVRAWCGIRAVMTVTRC